MKGDEQLSDGERWYLHSQTGSISDDIADLFKSLFKRRKMNNQEPQAEGLTGQGEDEELLISEMVRNYISVYEDDEVTVTLEEVMCRLVLDYKQWLLQSLPSIQEPVTEEEIGKAAVEASSKWLPGDHPDSITVRNIDFGSGFLTGAKWALSKQSQEIK